MNKILKPYLREFFLDFFEDILIKTWEAHIHVYKVLQLLLRHHLFVKHSKFSFGIFEVEYLGHIVGQDGVRLDPKKFQAMQEWPCHKSLKSLHVFLALTGYYNKFVNNYGKVVGPLKNILKTNVFAWNEAAKQAFSNLKQAMWTTLVLAMLDFIKPFVLECNTSDATLGIILK